MKKTKLFDKFPKSGDHVTLYTTVNN